MLLSAHKCESQKDYGVFCWFVSYFNIPIFEIFRALQNSSVRDIQKFICCLQKQNRTGCILEDLQSNFEIFASSILILFTSFNFSSEKSRLALYMLFAYQCIAF